MKTKQSSIILALIIIVIVFLQACVPAESPDSEDAIATAEEATMATGETQVDTPPPPPSPTWTIHPTVTSSPPETNFDYAGVSFYFNDLLADNIVAGINPGQYNEQAVFWSKPSHREFVFNNWMLSNAFHMPAIRVYSVADFTTINENVGNALVNLDNVLGTQPLNGGEMRVADLFNAGQLYYSNSKAIHFQNGSGARWLSQYGQAYFPIGKPNLFYTFQGFTDDGIYYVSIILPVNHPSLPPYDQVVLDDAFAENYENYAAEVRDQLNLEPDNSFIPSLVLLDELVGSLLVGDP
jgi:hypothetical protein